MDVLIIIITITLISSREAGRGKRFIVESTVRRALQDLRTQADPNPFVTSISNITTTQERERQDTDCIAYKGLI